MAEVHQLECSQARDEYARRLTARRKLETNRARLHGQIANARVATFVAAAVLAWFVFGPVKVAVGWLGLPVALFAVLLIWHEKVGRARGYAQRAAAFYEKGLARLDHRWAGTGTSGARFLDDQHPNSADLDLFGPGSLYQLLCTARTGRGEDTLAAWLRAPSSVEEIRSRQGAIAELRHRLDLREQLALLAAEVPAGVDLDALIDWGDAPSISFPPWSRPAAYLLAVLAVATLLGWLVAGTGASLFVLILLLEAAFAWSLKSRVVRVAGPVERRAHDLALFAGILAVLEQEHFTSKRLVQLRASLQTAGLPASQRIAQLSRLIDWLNAKHNQLFAPLAPLLLWTTQLAFAIERWRAAAGASVARWLAAVGDFEALCSLAAYAYENPDDPFPEIVPAGTCFDAGELGHPLLPKERCVRNDLRLNEELRVLFVSGSNMSGKSTLLRAVGVNAVLALAGAPVRALRLRISPLVIGATLRIQDSLQAGRSRFYAEITRVHQLIDLAKGTPPLLFLLDELFQGTNSHDRRLGAEAVVATFVNLGAIGLVTTHDLALTEIAGRLAPRAANVHFEDHFENGAIAFDYRMRPGVVTKSNALALMRAVGIDV